MFARNAAGTFRFGRFVLDCDRRALLADGAPVALSSRAFDILAILLAERDRVVGRDELVDRVWDGMAVGQNNLAVQVSALRAALATQPGGDGLILTIPGRGYRFVGDAAPVGPVDPIQPGPAPEQASHASSYPLAWSLAGLAILMLISMLVWRGKETGEKTAPRSSIAVLPFRNASEDRSQDYLADAITDDLTTDLSHIPGSVVIARDSADVFKNHTQRAQDVGRALNVRYLLEGSTRVVDSVIHANAQLIDAANGIQLASDQFDVPRLPVSSAQSAIVGRISGNLSTVLGQVEAARSLRERPDDPDATDLFFRARSILDRDKSLQGFEAAQALLEQAIRQQPGFGDALATLGWMLLRKNQVFQDPDETKDYAEAKVMIGRALRLAPRNTTALAAQGYAQAFEGDCHAATFSAEAALAIDISEVKALEVKARCMQLEAKLDEGEAALRQLIRLDPQGTSTKAHYLKLANIYMLKADYAKALDLVGRGTAGEPEPGQNEKSETMGHAEFAQLLLIGLRELTADHEAAKRLLAHYATIWPHRSVWRVACYFYRSQTILPGFKKFQGALIAAGMEHYARDDASEQPALLRGSDTEDADDFAAVPRNIPGATTLDAPALHALIEGGRKLTIIDLGWGEAVIASAIWYGPDYATVPKVGFAVDQSARAAQGDLATPIVVLSDGFYGTASFEAATRLVARGYTHVFWFRGGEEAWAEAGYPARSPRK